MHSVGAGNGGGEFRSFADPAPARQIAAAHSMAIGLAKLRRADRRKRYPSLRGETPERAGRIADREKG